MKLLSILPFSLTFASLLGFATADAHQRSGLRKSHLNRASALDKRFSGSAAYHGKATLEKRFNGQGTYFIDGLGACGQWSTASDYIVALNTCQYNGGAYCGKQLVITGMGHTATATVMDECPTCACGSLDMSQGLFESFAPTSVGEFAISWEWAGAAPPKPTTTKQVQPITTHSKTSTTHSTTSTTSSSSSSIAITSSMSTSVRTWSKTSTSASAAPTGGNDGGSNGNIAAQKQLVYLFGALAAFGKSQC